MPTKNKYAVGSGPRVPLYYFSKNIFCGNVSAIASQEFGQITPEFGFWWLLYDICVKIMGSGFHIMNAILANIPSNYHDFKIREQK